MTALAGQWIGAGFVVLLLLAGLRSAWRAATTDGALRASHAALAAGTLLACGAGWAGAPGPMLIGAALLLVAGLRLASRARGWDRRAAILQALGGLLLAGLSLGL